MHRPLGDTRTIRRRAAVLPAALAVLGALVLAGCDGFPRDIAGTTDRVTRTGTLRAGIVADARAEDDERALARTVAAAAGAEATMEPGSAEVLLHRLEDGGLDLVVGRFATASPWSGRVALTPPAAAGPDPDAHRPVLRAAVRNGENRWLMLVSRILEDA